jgi:hypothetical protein
MLMVVLFRSQEEQAEKNFHTHSGVPAAEDHHPGTPLYRRPGSESMECSSAQFLLLRDISRSRHLPTVQEDSS